MLRLHVMNWPAIAGIGHRDKVQKAIKSENSEDDAEQDPGFEVAIRIVSSYGRKCIFARGCPDALGKASALTKFVPIRKTAEGYFYLDLGTAGWLQRTNT